MDGSTPSPWRTTPQSSYANGRKERGSLGQFIERSTSAPPPSSEFAKHGSPYDDSLVGSDLLEHMSSAYADMDLNDKSQPHQSNDLGRLLSHNSGRSTAPTTTSSPSPYLQGFMSPAPTPEFYALPSMPAEAGLVRSQSAAPALHHGSLGPPPGLQFSQSDSYGQRRSASAGLLGQPPAPLRAPAAKTLMDLIQEDFPQETAANTSMESDDLSPPPSSSPRSTSYEAYDVYHRMPSSQPPPQEQQQQQQQASLYQPQLQHQSSMPSLPHHTPSSLQHAVQQQGPPPQYHHHQQQQQQQQQQLDNPFALRADPAMHQPYDHLRRQGSSDSGVYGAPGVHSPPLPSSVVYDGQQQQPQQQVYYQSPSAQQRVVHQQVLPGGHQTVYVQNQPSPPPYGYATIQYHSQPPPPQQQAQQRVIQTVSGEQYVSIVPVSNTGYWGQDQNASTMGSVAIMNQPGQIAVARVGHHLSPHLDRSSSYGRVRDPKGRGGRRGGRQRSDSKHPTTSPLLDEFRAMKNRDWTMHNIAGHVVEFCQDQNGSRFIQQRLEMGDPGEQQVVVEEVLPAIRRLRNDVFGNYVVQKLFDFGSARVKSEIRDTLEGEMLQLSLQMYGCRVVQKALEALSEDDLPRLLTEFHHNVLSCIHDQNGNHVIQKCIEVVSKRAKKAAAAGDEARATLLNRQIDFIIGDVLVNTASLSCHPYGCRVLQRILEHCEEGRKMEVLDEIRKCHRKLLDDQYGNYVIQHVLQFGRPTDRDSILAIVVESGLLSLSRQKFASNVVEKLLKHGNASQRRAIVREMLKYGDDPTVSSHLSPADGGTSVVLLMVRDAYANYVVQTTLDVVPESDEKRMLLQELNSHSEELRQYTFAKHIVAKLGTMTAS